MRRALMEIGASAPALEGLSRSAARAAYPFYRSYPYRGGLPIARADARGAVSLEHGFFYNRVPKAANSTVISALHRQAGGGETKASEVKNAYRRPSELDAAAVEKIGTDVVAFTVVRNPFTRVLSAFLDKVVRAGGRNYQARARRLGLSETPDFPAFCRFLDGGGLHDDAHWAPQADCMVLPVDAFTEIGKVESLDRDLNRIIERIFGTPPSEVGRAGPPETGAGKKIAEHYGAPEVQIVQKLYAADFELFQYDRDPAALI